MRIQIDKMDEYYDMMEKGEFENPKQTRFYTYYFHLIVKKIFKKKNSVLPIVNKN